MALPAISADADRALLSPVAADSAAPANRAPVRNGFAAALNQMPRWERWTMGAIGVELTALFISANTQVFKNMGEWMKNNPELTCLMLTAIPASIIAGRVLNRACSASTPAVETEEEESDLEAALPTPRAAASAQSPQQTGFWTETESDAKDADDTSGHREPTAAKPKKTREELRADRRAARAAK